MLRPGRAVARSRPGRGQALLELAILMPLLLACLLGGAQVGAIVFTNVNVEGAARSAALAASASPVGSAAYTYDGTTSDTASGPGVTCSAANPNSANPVCATWSTSQASLSSLVVTLHCGGYAGGACPDGTTSGECPPPSGWVTVQATATVPIFVPLVGAIFASGPGGGQRTVSDTVTMRVEPCGITNPNGS